MGPHVHKYVNYLPLCNRIYAGFFLLADVCVYNDAPRAATRPRGDFAREKFLQKIAVLILLRQIIRIRGSDPTTPLIYTQRAIKSRGDFQI